MPQTFTGYFRKHFFYCSHRKNKCFHCFSHDKIIHELISKKYLIKLILYYKNIISISKKILLYLYIFTKTGHYQYAKKVKAGNGSYDPLLALFKIISFFTVSLSYFIYKPAAKLLQPPVPRGGFFHPEL